MSSSASVKPLSEFHRRLTRIQAIERDPALAHADKVLCSTDLGYWVENWGWMTNPKADNPADREVPVRLWPEQRRLLEWFQFLWDRALPGLLVKSREIGASWLALHFIYHRWRFEEGFSALLGSRLERYVDDRTEASLFGKLWYIHSRQPRHLRIEADRSHLIISSLANSSAISGESTNENFGRAGRHGIILLDEYAFTPPRIAAQIWKARESTARTTFAVTTPGGKAHKSFELYQSLPREQVLELGWQTDPTRGTDFRERNIRSGLTAEEFEQEYNLQFGVARVGLIWTHQRDVLVYTDEDSRWKSIQHSANALYHVGGWDFGTGESFLVCLHALVDYSVGREKPRIWLDKEFVFRRTEWRVAAATVLDGTKASKGRTAHFGDPAGTAAESDQKSWESNLRSGGIPLSCLDAWFNTRDGIEWTLREVQNMIDEERLLVHHSCRQVLDCIGSWKRAVDDSVNPDFLDKAYIPPRKDVYSHTGDALRYLVGGVLRFAVKRPVNHEARRDDDDGVLESYSAEIARALSGR